MTIPSIVLGIFVSATIAVGFAFLRGANPTQLLIYIVVGQLGFWFGHLFGSMTNIIFIKFGPLLLGDGVLTEVLFLLVSVWLSYAESYSESGNHNSL